MIKKTYENPESELLIVRFEGNFCTSPGDYSDNGKVPGTGDDDDQGGF